MHVCVSVCVRARMFILECACFEEEGGGGECHCEYSSFHSFILVHVLGLLLFIYLNLL